MSRSKDRSAGVFGMLEALSSNPSSGYHSVTTSNVSVDEALSISRKAACHKPSKSRHYGSEITDKKVIGRMREIEVEGARRPWGGCV